MSKVHELQEQIAKSREELKAAFDSSEDGKYTPEAKEKIKGLNTELAGLVDDLKVENAKVENFKSRLQNLVKNLKQLSIHPKTASTLLRLKRKSKASTQNLLDLLMI